MELSLVSGCCSMAIISNNPPSDIDKNQFKNELITAFKISDKVKAYRIKTILMITNETETFFNKSKYRKFGFKKAYSYFGYNDKIANVFYLDFVKYMKKNNIISFYVSE